MPTKISFGGSSLTECIFEMTSSCIKNDQWKARKRELATFCFDTSLHEVGKPGTSTSIRLMPGNIFHVESLKRGRNVVLGDVVRGGFLGEVVEHVLR